MAVHWLDKKLRFDSSKPFWHSVTDLFCNILKKNNKFWDNSFICYMDDSRVSILGLADKNEILG